MSTSGGRPSIGRIVHYMARGSADGVFPPVCRAAIVTEVDPDDPDRIGAAAINPDGLFFHPLSKGGLALDEDTRAGGTWHWPCVIT